MLVNHLHNDLGGLRTRGTTVCFCSTFEYHVTSHVVQYGRHLLHSVEGERWADGGLEGLPVVSLGVEQAEVVDGHVGHDLGPERLREE